MDEELYQAFITESEESITQLNNSLLTLESNPGDGEAIDDIFRRAHTLKGNFGAMGFDDAATVAHAIEDLLDEVRQDRLEVTPERMDLVFDGVDRILDILHEIESNGESTLDPSDTVAAIRAAAEGAEEAGGDDDAADGDAGSDDGSADESDGAGVAGDAAADESGGAGEADASDAGDAADGATVESGGASGAGDGAGAQGVAHAARERALELVDEAELDAHDRAVHVDVSLEEGGMKGVDAGLFFGGIPETVSVLATDPPQEDIEAGEYEDGFELLVAGLGAGETGETFGDLWAVEEVTVADVTADAGEATSAAGSDDGDPGSTPDEADVPDGAGNGHARGSGDGGDAGESGGDGGESADGGNGDGSAGGDDGGESADGGNGDGSAGGDDGGSDQRSISAVKSVRVDVDQLDELHELVEQLVTSRIKLRRAIDTEAESADSLETLDELDKISTNLQNTVMDMRLIPLKKVFDKFPRLVRDLAREEEKQVDFRVEGQDIELDRTILDEISDPLMHVLRNAVDHGIEPPEEREAAGKSPTGTVELSAEREHDTVVITVADDGGGLDVDAIREKAVSEGVATRDELASLPEEEVFQYIFHPGFSTNEEITDVSGRGVGMDVVKTTVESLDGTVSVSSVPGQGTTFRIRLPVSVAIIKVLFVQVDDREFGVPIKHIDEISRLNGVESINGTEVVVHEDRVFPLIRLRDALGIDAPADGDGMVVRIRPMDRQVALHCDRVIRQEEVVVTPLQGPLSGAQGLSGTAVIGDGNVIPIVDVGTLELTAAAKRAMHEGTTGRAAEEATAEEAAD